MCIKCILEIIEKLNSIKLVYQKTSSFQIGIEDGVTPATLDLSNIIPHQSSDHL